MKRILIGVLTLFLFSSYANSQTVVKLLLPDNCEANTTEVETIKIETLANLVVFPNPSSGIFSLYANFTDNIKTATIEVYNISGTLVHTEAVFCDSPKLVRQLSLTKLSPGYYFVRIIAANKVLSTKLLIQ